MINSQCLYQDKVEPTFNIDNCFGHVEIESCGFATRSKHYDAHGKLIKITPWETYGRLVAYSEPKKKFSFFQWLFK